MPEHSDPFVALVTEMLESGVEDRDAMVDAALQTVDVDIERVRRGYYTKAISWALTKVRDDLGKRLVYQVREHGRHLAIHLDRTTDFVIVRKIAMSKKSQAKALDLEADRLFMVSEQLEMQFPAEGLAV